MKKSQTFHLVSLGCAKNTVDSDSMAQLLMRDGYRGTEIPEEADVLIVNTCGFIGPAKDESIEVLHELAEIKKGNQILIAAGCLTQRYGMEVARKVPGVDGVLGTRRWMDIVQVVRELRKGPHPEPLYHLPDEAATVGTDEQNALRASVAGASAYLKVADGCRRPCAFCAIPLIKGTAVSRPVETIIDEARRLRDSGVRELILIAQDTTDYGHDLGMKDGLAILLEKLTETVPDMEKDLYIEEALLNARENADILQGIIDPGELERYYQYLKDYREISRKMEELLQAINSYRDTAYQFSFKLAELLEEHIGMVSPSLDSGIQLSHKRMESPRLRVVG